MARNNLSVGTKIGFGFTLSLVLLIAVGWIPRSNAVALLDTANLVTHTHEVLEILARVTTQVREAESSARGFALTGDPKMLPAQRLEPERLIEKLRYERATTPKQQANVEVLLPVLHAKMNFQEAIAQTRREQGLEAAARLIGSGEGRVAMEDILRIVERMVAEEADTPHQAQRGRQEVGGERQALDSEHRLVGGPARVRDRLVRRPRHHPLGGRARGLVGGRARGHPAARLGDRGADGRRRAARQRRAAAGGRDPADHHDGRRDRPDREPVRRAQPERRGQLPALGRRRQPRQDGGRRERATNRRAQGAGVRDGAEHPDAVSARAVDRPAQRHGR